MFPCTGQLDGRSCIMKAHGAYIFRVDLRFQFVNKTAVSDSASATVTESLHDTRLRGLIIGLSQFANTLSVPPTLLREVLRNAQSKL